MPEFTDQAAALRAYYAALDAAPAALWRMLATKGWVPWPANMAPEGAMASADLIPVDHTALPEQWVELLGRYGAVLLATYEQSALRGREGYTDLLRYDMVTRDLQLGAEDPEVGRVLAGIYSMVRRHYPCSVPLIVWWLDGRADWRIIHNFMAAKRENSWNESEFARSSRSL